MLCTAEMSVAELEHEARELSDRQRDIDTEVSWRVRPGEGYYVRQVCRSCKLARPWKRHEPALVRKLLKDNACSQCGYPMQVWYRWKKSPEM